MLDEVDRITGIHNSFNSQVFSVFEWRGDIINLTSQIRLSAKWWNIENFIERKPWICTRGRGLMPKFQNTPNYGDCHDELNGIKNWPFFDKSHLMLCTQKQENAIQKTSYWQKQTFFNLLIYPATFHHSEPHNDFIA